jgi:drug/metabolite transporter (DMT)-like permease
MARDSGATARPAEAAIRPRARLAAVVPAMGLLYVVWGSTYLAIRVAVETLPPFVSAGVRFVAGALIMAVVVAVRGGLRDVVPSRRQLVASAGLGVWLLVGGPGVLTLAETEVPSNLAAVLASTTSIWVVLYALAEGKRISRRVAVGVAAGFGGVALLLLPGTRRGEVSIPWMLLVVASSLLWSSGSYYGRRLPALADPFVAAALQMLVAGAVLVVLGLARGEANDLELSRVSLESAGALAYLAVASAAAFAAYLWLLQRLPISTVVTHQYVNPVVAVFLGWAILSEPVTATVLAGSGLVVGAVAIIVSGERS